jgi:hypothetical protein
MSRPSRGPSRDPVAARIRSENRPCCAIGRAVRDGTVMLQQQHRARICPLAGGDNAWPRELPRRPLDSIMRPQSSLGGRDARFGD